MSEVKHTPLPLPRKVGGHVWLIELPGQGITIADKTMAFNLVNRYNAGPKVEELVEAAKDAQAVIALFAHGRGLDSREASTQKRLEQAIREVEAALKGSAQ